MYYKHFSWIILFILSLGFVYGASNLADLNVNGYVNLTNSSKDLIVAGNIKGNIAYTYVQNPPWETVSNVNTKISNNVSLLYPLNNPYAFYNSTSIPAYLTGTNYTTLDNKINSIGNWSSDKNSYDTTTTIDAKNLAQNNTIALKALPGNCASGTVVQNTTTSGVQCITMSANSGEPAWQGNTSTVARTGTCSAGQVVQNTTTAGVQCVSTGGTGTVTQINSGVYTTGGVITGSGTIDVNTTSLTVNIGNWSADKGSYATITSLNNNLSLYTTITSLTNNLSLYVLYSNLVNSIGNWTNDKVNYNTTTQLTTLYSLISEPKASSLGNWSNDKSSYNTTTQLNTLYASNTAVTNNVSISNLQTVLNQSNLTVNNITTNYFKLANPPTTCGGGTWVTSFNGLTQTCTGLLSTDITVLGFNTTSQANTMYYPLGSNPAGFYNSSTIPAYASNTALVNNLTNIYANDTSLQSQIVSIGNWSSDKVNYNTTVQLRTIFTNQSILGNCGAGTIVQNITSTGIQCVTDQTGGGGFTNGTDIRVGNLNVTGTGYLSNSPICTAGNGQCSASLPTSGSFTNLNVTNQLLINNHTSYGWGYQNNSLAVGSIQQYIGTVTGQSWRGVGVFTIDNADTNAYNLVGYTASNTQPVTMGLYRARGNKTTPLILQNGDTIANIPFAYYDGVDFDLGANINVSVDGTPSVNNTPSKIAFQTTPNGSNTPIDRLTIDSKGAIKIIYNLTIDNGTGFFDTTANFFGVNTLTPSSALHVVGSENLTGNFTIGNPSTTNFINIGNNSITSNTTCITIKTLTVTKVQC